VCIGESAHARHVLANATNVSTIKPRIEGDRDEEASITSITRERTVNTSVFGSSQSQGGVRPQPMCFVASWVPFSC
jgi:hypothetical protein